MSERVTAESLTDEQIRAEWIACDHVWSMEHYYALKRNARRRAGLQGDDEFSQYCEYAASFVADRVNARMAKDLERAVRAVGALEGAKR